jgi:hypothetical protein
MLPAFSDCTRLLEAFLAGRNPRTLAAYQADLEDFRRFMETLSESPPTLATAVVWLLGGSASAYALLYRLKMSNCRSRRSTAASPPCGRWSNSATGTAL